MNDMKHKADDIKTPEQQADQDGKMDLPGYPMYPAGEDIYKKFKEEGSIDPEDTTKTKSPNEHKNAGEMNEKGFLEDPSGGDLDVPGSELDDPQENVGNEDEENNYYSLGGDDHSDLDEEQGD